MLSLLKGLPPNSAVHRAINPEGWAWGNQEELMATTAELIDYGNRLLLLANSKQGTKPPRPIQIRRPKQPTERKGTTMAEFREMLLADGAVHVS